MQAKNISRGVLERAAIACNVSVDLRPLNKAETRWQCKVNPPINGDPNPYPRVSWQGRRVHAVCWHGFRDFFRECYKFAPDATFRTGLDTWKNSDDFEARYRESGTRAGGPPINPLRHCDLCTCPDAGTPE